MSVSMNEIECSVNSGVSLRSYAHEIRAERVAS